MRIDFVHMSNTKNVGDLQSSPYRHFAFGDDIAVHDVRALPREPGDAVVYGGGAIGAMLTKAPVRAYLSRAKRAVAWGVGRSVRGATGPQSVPVNQFNLYGTREWPAFDGQCTVPCVSCMSPLLDQQAEPSHEAVLFYNKRKRKPGVDMPSLSNEEPLHRVVDHLLSGRTVVTNSYHGAYWAVLLGRPVIIVGAYSSKFSCYPWPVPMRADTHWRAALPQTATFPRALATARHINIQFYKRVLEVLNA